MKIGRTISLLVSLVMNMLHGADMDTIYLADGATRSGWIKSIDANFIRIQLPSPDPEKASLIVAEPRNRITSVDFSAAPEIQKSIDTISDRNKLAQLWMEFPLSLDLAQSPMGRLGIAYARALIMSPSENDRLKALSVFSLVEEKAWSEADRIQARVGRFQTLSILNRFRELLPEAHELVRGEFDAGLRSEAALLIGREKSEALQKILEENPRWAEDVRIRSKRHRLYHEAIEWNLFPAVLLGSESRAAASGLWSALLLLQQGEDMDQAVKIARDLVFLYPSTQEASKAQQWLDQLPSELLEGIDDFIDPL